MYDLNNIKFIEVDKLFYLNYFFMINKSKPPAIILYQINLIRLFKMINIICFHCFHFSNHDKKYILDLSLIAPMV